MHCFSEYSEGHWPQKHWGVCKNAGCWVTPSLLNQNLWEWDPGNLHSKRVPFTTCDFQGENGVKCAYKERPDLACGGRAAWAPGDVLGSPSVAAEVGEALRGINSVILFKDVARGVKRSQYSWQINKHTRVVKNKLTFGMKLWSCKNKKYIFYKGGRRWKGKRRGSDRPSVEGERSGDTQRTV